MTAIIIEDELLAQEKLEAMLHRLDGSIAVTARLASVKDALSWLATNPPPDVAFVDIQLSDDHSFEIFRRHHVSFPVIFTTAFDKYLLQSFEYNTIDYLLKPVTEEKLQRSLQKIKGLERHFVQANVMKMISHHAAPPAPARVVARKGTEFVALDVHDIAYFFTEHKIVFARHVDGRQLIVDKNLGELESELTSAGFFRLNRKFLVQRKAIDRFKPDSGRIRVFLKPDMPEVVHVSKESAPEFRNWIEGLGER